MLRKQKCGDSLFATKFPNESYESFCKRIPKLKDSESLNLCSNFELYATYNNLFNQNLAYINLKSTSEFHYFLIKENKDEIVIPMSAKFEKLTFGFLKDLFEKFDNDIESFQLYIVGFDGTVSGYSVYNGIKEPEEKQTK